MKGGEHAVVEEKEGSYWARENAMESLTVTITFSRQRTQEKR